MEEKIYIGSDNEYNYYVHSFVNKKILENGEIVSVQRNVIKRDNDNSFHQFFCKNNNFDAFSNKVMSFDSKDAAIRGIENYLKNN